MCTTTAPFILCFFETFFTLYLSMPWNLQESSCLSSPSLSAGITGMNHHSWLQSSSNFLELEEVCCLGNRKGLKQGYSVCRGRWVGFLERGSCFIRQIA